MDPSVVKNLITVGPFIFSLALAWELITPLKRYAFWTSLVAHIVSFVSLLLVLGGIKGEAFMIVTWFTFGIGSKGQPFALEITSLKLLFSVILHFFVVFTFYAKDIKTKKRGDISWYGISLIVYAVQFALFSQGLKEFTVFWLIYFLVLYSFRFLAPGFLNLSSLVWLFIPFCILTYLSARQLVHVGENEYLKNLSLFVQLLILWVLSLSMWIFPFWKWIRTLLVPKQCSSIFVMASLVIVSGFLPLSFLFFKAQLTQTVVASYLPLVGFSLLLLSFAALRENSIESFLVVATGCFFNEQMIKILAGTGFYIVLEYLVFLVGLLGVAYMSGGEGFKDLLRFRSSSLAHRWTRLIIFVFCLFLIWRLPVLFSIQSDLNVLRAKEIVPSLNDIYFVLILLWKIILGFKLSHFFFRAYDVCRIRTDVIKNSSLTEFASDVLVMLVILGVYSTGVSVVLSKGSYETYQAILPRLAYKELIDFHLSWELLVASISVLSIGPIVLTRFKIVKHDIFFPLLERIQNKHSVFSVLESIRENAIRKKIDMIDIVDSFFDKCVKQTKLIINKFFIFFQSHLYDETRLSSCRFTLSLILILFGFFAIGIEFFARGFN